MKMFFRKLINVSSTFEKISVVVLIIIIGLALLDFNNKLSSFFYNNLTWEIFAIGIGLLLTVPYMIYKKIVFGIKTEHFNGYYMIYRSNVEGMYEIQREYATLKFNKGESFHFYSEDLINLNSIIGEFKINLQNRNGTLISSYEYLNNIKAEYPSCKNEFLIDTDPIPTFRILNTYGQESYILRKPKDQFKFKSDIRNLRELAISNFSTEILDLNVSK